MLRNLSPQLMFEKIAQEHKPICRFRAPRQRFAQWKKSTWPKVLATLGDLPPRVPLNPELIAEFEHDGLLKQRWLIDVGPHISAVFLINRPKQIKSGEKRPAILCWHGHGLFGKAPVMGDDSSLEMRESIKQHNYNYGHQMAKAGFVTYAIDWIGCGDRNDSRKPNHLNQNGNRDWCNLYYLHATMLGMTSISINVTHGMAATDFACTFPFVDKTKLGVMGLSGGGTMTTWTALCDKRMKAVEIICYSDLWAYFGIRDINYCGMQVAPGLFKLVDLPDLQGLIAPKPLLIDIGVYDTCFLIDGAMMCFQKLEKIYKAAGAGKNIELDLFPGEHSWGGHKSVNFFNRYLKATPEVHS
ncbi:MAG: prolyl oligopeptidase family serine peptidase [Verrucomicrobia bacterium]|nr:prolyl oligopeptidase family serine peptidase [Verrucomicrobiota bacterium]MBU1735506.1 prolyl oligopeptidase family serine peptidase [Verrucomicrobiota bacterium]MBU1856901.1 prolyl oligopeptidase family serine peptidase [Verrucomicrobiota bacterium]